MSISDHHLSSEERAATMLARHVGGHARFIQKNQLGRIQLWRLLADVQRFLKVSSHFFNGHHSAVRDRLQTVGNLLQVMGIIHSRVVLGDNDGYGYFTERPAGHD